MIDFTPLADTFSSIESQNNLPAGTLNAVMQTESGGNPNAVGTSGEQGMFQFMPATAQRYKIDPTDPMQSAQGAGKLLGHLYSESGNNMDATLRGYNAGEGNMYNPTISNKYIQKVNSYMPSSPSADASDTVSTQQSSTPQIDFTPLNNSEQSSTPQIDFTPLGTTTPQAPPSTTQNIMNTIQDSSAGAASAIPGAKQFAGGLSYVLKGGAPGSYEQGKQLYDQMQGQSQNRSPIAYGGTNIAVNTAPFMATGPAAAGAGLGKLGTLALRSGLNAGVASGEALNSGASPTGAAITGAIAGPAAELVAPTANIVGNIGKAVGDLPLNMGMGALKKAMGVVKPPVAAQNFDDIIGLKNFDLEPGFGQPPGGTQSLWQRMYQNNPAGGYGGTKQNILHAATELPGLVGELALASAHPIAAIPAMGTATQYSAALISYIAKSQLNPAVKAALIQKIQQGNQ